MPKSADKKYKNKINSLSASDPFKIEVTKKTNNIIGNALAKQFKNHGTRSL
jgi:hypothetical protein